MSNSERNNYSFNSVNGFTDNKTRNYSAPINFNIGTGVLGSYDNIRLETNCKEGWKGPPCNPPTKSNTLWLPQGTPLPLKNEMIYSELPKDSMFVFANSVSSLDCRGTYTTDRGPICTTDFQRKYIGEQRGLNKSYENYNF
jgi:hypothetical protein